MTEIQTKFYPDLPPIGLEAPIAVSGHDLQTMIEAAPWFQGGTYKKGVPMEWWYCDTYQILERLPFRHFQIKPLIMRESQPLDPRWVDFGVSSLVRAIDNWQPKIVVVTDRTSRPFAVAAAETTALTMEMPPYITGINTKPFKQLVETHRQKLEPMFDDLKDHPMFETAQQYWSQRLTAIRNLISTDTSPVRILIWDEARIRVAAGTARRIIEAAANQIGIQIERVYDTANRMDYNNSPFTDLVQTPTASVESSLQNNQIALDLSSDMRLFGRLHGLVILAEKERNQIAI